MWEIVVVREEEKRGGGGGKSKSSLCQTHPTVLFASEFCLTLRENKAS